MSDLIKGIGVIIDDKIFAKSDEEGDKIVSIRKTIEKAKIPLVLYNKLPSTETLEYFTNVSFFIVDWKLDDVSESVTVGATLANQNTDALLSFLARIKENCLAPVFIFSNEDIGSIEQKLEEKNLWAKNSGKNFIFVRKKRKFNPLKTIEKWIKKTPSLYVLNQWRNDVSTCQAKMFSDLHSASPHWASLLWKSYEDDGDSPKHALIDLLTRNLRGRLQPTRFTKKLVLPKNIAQDAHSYALNVHERAFCIPDASLSCTFSCGDVFKNGDGESVEYKINIRCDCDCVKRDKKQPLLYLLSSTKFEGGEKPKDKDLKRNGVVQKRNNAHYIYPVDNGQWVKFSFTELEQTTSLKLKRSGFSRICRLTAPHLTDIRQRFAQWLQREGYPKIPTIP